MLKRRSRARACAGYLKTATAIDRCRIVKTIALYLSGRRLPGGTHGRFPAEYLSVRRSKREFIDVMLLYQHYAGKIA